jgi:DNA-binding transcriptional LysR family regulator
MSLSSINLDAFFAVAQQLNFSKAAKTLFVTQSALSQRIKQLEEDLGLTLLVRNPRAVSLTAEGERLLRYCQIRTTLESEVLSELKGDRGSLGGALKIAGFSTVLRSIVIPCISPLLRNHPQITPFIYNAEIRELTELLIRGEAHYIIMDQEVDRNGLGSTKIGEEQNVLVQSNSHSDVPEVYLDHDPDDQTTYSFLKLQGQKNPKFRRAFFDEIYSVIDGVAEGVGKAVVPKHLAVADSRLKIASGKKSLKVPWYLVYCEQPVETNLHKAVLQAFKIGVPKILN